MTEPKRYSPDNPDAYADVRTASDSAIQHYIEGSAGAGLTFDSPRDARLFRQRFYKMRRLDRLASRELFEPGDPRWGTSGYDNLQVLLDECAVRLEVVEPRVLPIVGPIERTPA